MEVNTTLNKEQDNYDTSSSNQVDIVKTLLAFSTANKAWVSRQNERENIFCDFLVFFRSIFRWIVWRGGWLAPSNNEPLSSSQWSLKYLQFCTFPLLSNKFTAFPANVSTSTLDKISIQQYMIVRMVAKGYCTVLPHWFWKFSQSPLSAWGPKDPGSQCFL